MSKPPPEPIFTLRGHQGPVTSVRFTSTILNAQLSLVSSSECGEIFLWDLKTFRTKYKWIGHDSKNILWVDTIGDKVVSQGRDGNLQFWTFSENSWNTTCTKRHSAVGFCQCSLLKRSVSPLLACPSKELSTIEIVDISTMQVIMSTLNLLPENQKFGMCMNCKLVQFPNNNKTMLICGFENGSIVLYSVEEKCLVSKIMTRENPVICLDYDTEFQQKGISASVDNILSLWSYSDRKELVEVQKTEIKNPGVTSLAIRSDAKIVCTGGTDTRIRVFSWKTMRSLAVLSHHSDSVQCLAFSDKTEYSKDFLFAAGSRDKKISLWNFYNS